MHKFPIPNSYYEMEKKKKGQREGEKGSSGEEGKGDWGVEEPSGADLIQVIKMQDGDIAQGWSAPLAYKGSEFQP